MKVRIEKLDIFKLLNRWDNYIKFLGIRKGFESELKQYIENLRFIINLHGLNLFSILFTWNLFRNNSDYIKLIEEKYKEKKSKSLIEKLRKEIKAKLRKLESLPLVHRDINKICELTFFLDIMKDW